MKANNAGLLAAAVAAAVLSAATGAFASPAEVHIDHRGLFIVRGVTTKGNWPGANLVAFGPNWEYSAQDYAAKMSKKELEGWDRNYDGTLGVPNAKMKVHQEFRFGKDKSCAVKWELRPDGRNNLNSARAYVFVPLDWGVFEGGRCQTEGGAEKAFPEKEEWLPKGGKTTFISPDGKTSFAVWNVKCGGWKIAVDKGKKSIQIQFEYADPRGAKATAVEFSFIGEGDAKFAMKDPPRAEIMKAGDDFVEFPFKVSVKDGSALDFSKVFKNDIPAGKFGRLVPSKDGRLVYEKTGKSVRLIGANLNFDANMVDKKWADKTAKDFRQLGYNAVRYHHIDVWIQKGDWNAWSTCNFDESRLDLLDYMFCAMKREGMYSTTDLFQMRRCGKGEVPGLDDGLDWAQLKSFLPYMPGAVENWKMFAKKLLDHVNPYTKLAWKDDPSLVFIVPVNEDSVVSVVPGEKSKAYPFFKKAFDDWRAKGLSKLPVGSDEKAVKMEFLNWAKARFDAECVRFLKKELGYKGLVTSENWYELKSQAVLRNSYDLVDNHGYADHPQGWPPPQRWNQTPNNRGGNLAYQVPLIKGPSRIMDKPMSITEWNFCAPNKFRAESGVNMGAYAALQDWSMLYRFAWSHSAKFIEETSPIKGFDIVNDPINEISERINVLLFRRGDVKRANESYCYAVNDHEAYKDGPGDMWSRGRFPGRFVTQGFLHRVGSMPVAPGMPIRGKWTAVVSEDEIPAALLNGNAWKSVKDLPDYSQYNNDLVSDTGEIVLSRSGRLTVATPRTEAVVAYPKSEGRAGRFVAGGLEVKPVDVYSVVAASSLDNAPLRESKRIILFHLTNAVNTDERFDGPGWHAIKENGRIPYLAKTGRADVSLKAAKGLKLFALRYDGTRIREVPARYSGGAYSFTLSISPKEEAAMVYELSAK